MHDSLGDRIKRYEQTSSQTLLPRGWVLLRVDGRAFHTFTKKMQKPFDDELINAMVTAGERTAMEMAGFRLGYHQSDEFTFALTDTASFETQMWFDGNIQKLCSITASLFTVFFNKEMGGTEASFDCRAFNVPEEDVANVFVWRQRDWERNSVQMLARSLFSQKELDGKNLEEMRSMIIKAGNDWNKIRADLKHGTFIFKGEPSLSQSFGYHNINNLLGITR